MATSGTYTFNPSLGETVLYAYNNIEIRSTSLTQEHMEVARMATNLALASFSNQGVNLWKVDLVEVPLIIGQATYSVNPNTVIILDAYISVNSTPPVRDRIILPISRTEYASYPNKDQEGFPSVFWNDRLIAPTITLYPVPQQDNMTLKYYRLVQIQDANYSNGQQVEIPYLWLDALTDEIIVRLARIWATARVQEKMLIADKSYMMAANRNIENAQQYIVPMIGGYFSRQ